MRYCLPALILALIIIYTNTGVAFAQPVSAQNVTLYAHGTSRILNANPQWGGQLFTNVSNPILFSLNPVLGYDLRISGAISMTVYLKASAPLFGNLIVEALELTRSGTQIPVPGTRIDSPTSLQTRVVPFTLGIGIIDYKFRQGSSIQLSVRFASNGNTPYLLWDAAATPASITIPAVSPLIVHLTFSSSRGAGRMIPISNRTAASVNALAAVSDVFGLYRFGSTAMYLTPANGSSIKTLPSTTKISDYNWTFSFSSVLNAGAWIVSLRFIDYSSITYEFTDRLWVSTIYPVFFTVQDESGFALENVGLTVTSYDQHWTATTNSTGMAFLSLPSTDIVGPLNVSAKWHNAAIRPLEQQITVGPGPTIIILKVALYDINIRASLGGVPLPAVQITLLQGTATVADGTTGLSGVVTFRDIPPGVYTVNGSNLLVQGQTSINVTKPGVWNIYLPTPFPFRHPFILLAVLLLAASTSIFVVRRRSKTYLRSFRYFKELTNGGLPNSCFVTIIGGSGSGKTTLLQSFAIEHLLEGRSCVYIANTEYPAKVRESMMALGGRVSAQEFKLLFIDSYSTLGGTQPTEDYYVSSLTDLTALGLMISKCLDQLGPNTDIFFDSANPLLTALKIDYLLNFLQSIAAKVKASEGRLYLTTGSSFEKNDLTKLEEASDCVIETQVQDVRQGQRRRLRVKKLRGRPYVDKWVSFQVESGKGIIFLTREKPGRT
jgi:KaiC/GvpD/RAD55 family RecA-like ATPase